MGLIKEFRSFINRGNVLDLAVAVIIGAAFAKIVSALTDDFISPLLGLVTGRIDFSNLYLAFGSVPVGASLAQARAAGVPVLAYGHFLTEVIDFLILAFVVFLLVRFANRLLRREEVASFTEIELLTEIRDELRRARG